jgi:hypothetical protein
VDPGAYASFQRISELSALVEAQKEELRQLRQSQQEMLQVHEMPTSSQEGPGGQPGENSRPSRVPCWD